MNTITIELEDETLESLDEIAYADHRGNREAAIRALLDTWLQRQH